MREIVYFYINKFKNIHKQGFNFGSEYEYYTENIDKKIIVKRRKNDLFIPNFFQTENSDSIINISAFVGENGAGKSNILDALKFALTQDRDDFEYFFVFKNANGKLYCENNESLNIEYSFEQFERTSVITEVIYYNPSLDSKIYPITHSYNAWIDISTDWLIYGDVENSNQIKPKLSQIEIFNSNEIERQLNLLNDTNFTNFLNDKINIPTEIRIVSFASDFPDRIDDSNLEIRNVPFIYREFYNSLHNKVKIALDNYTTNEYSLIDQENLEDEYNVYLRKKCFVTFLSHLLKNIFFHLNLTGENLLKSNTSVNINDLKNIDYKEAIYTFIRNIDLIDNPEAIIDFAKNTENLIINSQVYFTNYGEISWVTPKAYLKDFLSFEGKYLEQLSELSNQSLPRTFIS